MDKQTKKDLALGVGTGAGAGLASYHVYDFFSSRPEHKITQFFENIGDPLTKGLGKRFIRNATKNSFGAKLFMNTMTRAGKNMGKDKVGKGVGSSSTDFTRLSKGKSNLKGLAALALLLGVSTGLEDMVRKGVNNYFNKNASEDVAYKQQLVDDIIEKVASNKYDNYANRMIVHGLIRPAIGTLGFIAAALALNKIFKLDERYGRLKFEPASSAVKGKGVGGESKLAYVIAEEMVSLADDFGMIEKNASTTGFVDRVADKLRAKIRLNPFLKEVDEFLSVPKRKEDTEEGLAFLVLEGGPREALRRAIYLSPFAAFGFDPRIRSSNKITSPPSHYSLPKSNTVNEFTPELTALNKLSADELYNEEVKLLEKIGEILGEDIEELSAEEKKEIENLLHNYKSFREGKKYLQRMLPMEQMHPVEELEL